MNTLMCGQSASLSNDRYFLGREDLKVPDINSRPTSILHWGGNLFIRQFFVDLWLLNGFDPSTEFPYNGSGYPVRNYTHELVVPDEPRRPLTVIRSSYNARHKHDIEYDLRLEDERANCFTWDNPMRVGDENHEILTAPDRIGSFATVLAWKNGEVRGPLGSYMLTPADKLKAVKKAVLLLKESGNSRPKLQSVPPVQNENRLFAD